MYLLNVASVDGVIVVRDVTGAVVLSLPSHVLSADRASAAVIEGLRREACSVWRKWSVAEMKRLADAVHRSRKTAWDRRIDVLFASFLLRRADIRKRTHGRHVPRKTMQTWEDCAKRLATDYQNKNRYRDPWNRYIYNAAKNHERKNAARRHARECGQGDEAESQGASDRESI